MVKEGPWISLMVILYLLLSCFSPNGRGGGPYQAPSLAMRILAWNCQGAGRAPTVRAIKPLSRDSCPDVMFLAKSKSPHSRMEDVRLKLGFESLFCEEAKGRAGGLAPFLEERSGFGGF
jgi:hypothetical protein